MTRGNGRVQHRRRSRRPFRDTVLVYAVFAALVVAVGLLTGGGIVAAALWAALAFVLATSWTWWRLRRREEQKRR